MLSRPERDQSRRSEIRPRTRFDSCSLRATSLRRGKRELAAEASRSADLPMVPAPCQTNCRPTPAALETSRRTCGPLLLGQRRGVGRPLIAATHKLCRTQARAKTVTLEPCSSNGTRRKPMNPQSRRAEADDMRAEYDFSNGVRGVHHQAYAAGTNVVFLEPDLVEAFPDSASVNQALRLLVRLSQSKALVGSRPNKALQPTSRARKKRKSKGRSRAARG
jgi:hypothetical protein